jgi:hypothetical protein
MSRQFTRTEFRRNKYVKHIRKSKLCGCFNCLRIFPSRFITETDWSCEEDDLSLMARCPYCGRLAVVGSRPKQPVTLELLGSLYIEWGRLDQERSFVLPAGTLQAVFRHQSDEPISH